MKNKFWLKIKDKVSDLVNMYRQIGLDRKYHKIYMETLDSEFSDRESEFVKMNLKYDPETYNIMFMLKIPMEFQQTGQDWMILDKLNEDTFFVTEFLKKKAGFDNYITPIPEFFHVEDPTIDDGDNSPAYLAIWKFMPMINDKMKKKLIWYPVSGVSLAGILTVLGILFL